MPVAYLAAHAARPVHARPLELGDARPRRRRRHRHQEPRLDDRRRAPAALPAVARLPRQDRRRPTCSSSWTTCSTRRRTSRTATASSSTTAPPWLTVPLERGAQTDRICDKRIDNRGSAEASTGSAARGARSRSTTARAVLRRATRDELRGRLHAAVGAAASSSTCTCSSSRVRWFEHHTPIVRASSLGLTGQKTDRIDRHVPAPSARRCYLSGGGGSRGYLDIEQLGRAGVARDVAALHAPGLPAALPGARLHAAPRRSSICCSTAATRRRDILFERSRPRDRTRHGGAA